MAEEGLTTEEYLKSLDARIEGIRIALPTIINCVVPDAARERAANNLRLLALAVNPDAPKVWREEVQSTMNDLAEILVKREGE